MVVERVTRSYSNSINVVTIGSGDNAVQVGGQTGLPFLYEEGDMPNKPVIALDVYDQAPASWTDSMREALGDVIDDPVAWARKGAEEWGVDLISLRLTQHSAEENPATPEECAELAEEINEAVGLPMIIWGSGEEKDDNDMFPQVSQALAGEQCLLGTVTEDNYKTLAATCIADGHNIIGESPIDINICKQVNILLSDMGFPLDKIVIFATNGPLGYGLEYAYTIMERTRLAAFGGDKMMAMPIIADIGPECQRPKEIKVTEEEEPTWGPERERGIGWEAATAATYLQAGADILTMLNPQAIKSVKKYIDDLMPEE